MIKKINTTGVNNVFTKYSQNFTKVDQPMFISILSSVAPKQARRYLNDNACSEVVGKKVKLKHERRFQKSNI